MTAAGLAEPTRQTARALERLHPTAAALPLGSLDELLVAPEFTPNSTLKALRAFPRGTAPGPSGLRAQHLFDAMTPATRATVSEQLAAVCQTLANGEAPRQLAPHLAGANLVALAKEDGGLRPIAVGAVLRRLTGKVLCEHVKARARQ